VDPSGWASRVRRAAGRRAALERLAEQADVKELPAAALALLALRLWAVGSRARAVGLLGRAPQQYPRDFWLNRSLGQGGRVTDPPKEHLECPLRGTARRGQH